MPILGRVPDEVAGGRSDSRRYSDVQQSKEWLGLRVVAERLGLSVSSVYRLIDEGELSAYRFRERGEFRVRAADVDALIERSRVGAAA